MEIEVGKIVGRVSPPTGGGGWWAQVHDFTPAEGTKQSLRGRLLAAVSLHQLTPAAQLEVEMVAWGREVLGRLHELYYGQLANNPLDQLRQAVETVAQETPGVELVCVSLVGQAIYVVVAGGGGVWVRLPAGQGWVVKPVADGQARLPDGQAKGLSGRAVDGQLLVAGNSQFWVSLPLGVVKAALQGAPSEAVETLAAILHGGEKGEGGAGIIIKITNLPAKQAGPPAPQPSPGPPEGIKAKLKTWLLKRVGPIYVAYPDRVAARRRTTRAGVAFLLLLLVLVGGFRVRSQQLARRRSELDLRLEAVVYKYNQAKALVSLNPVRSRQLLGEVEEELVQLQRDKRAKKDARLGEIQVSFGEVLGAASGVKRPPVTEVVDLTWLRQGMRGAKMRWVEGKLAVLDTQGDRLVVVDPTKRSGEIVVGKEGLGEAQLLATYPGKILVLSDKGIVDAQLPGSPVQIEPDKSWGRIVDIAMFAGNVYLLTTQNVWRYQVTESGYGAKQAWLAPRENPDLNGSLGLAIDGNIWVLKSQGEILKFTRGVRENFAVSGLPAGQAGLDKELGAEGALYTDEASEKLYILDQANGRVVVVTKTGAYESQYQVEEARAAHELVVDESRSQIYLLGGSKIWAVKL